jgi:hypothetical protein
MTATTITHSDDETARRVRFGDFSVVYVLWGLLMVVALIAPEQSPNLELYRTFYTIRVAAALMIPALCLFLFREWSRAAYAYWLLFWVFSYLAYLVHFYWSVWVIFGGIGGTFRGQGVAIASVNFALTVWWGFDVVLALFVGSERKWIKIQRGLIHLLVAVIFIVTLLYLRGDNPMVRAIGYAMFFTIAISGVVWLIVRERDKPVAPPAPPAAPLA